MAERIAFKRLQVLAEMNEIIYTLTSIEEVLDEINQCIEPIHNSNTEKNHKTSSPNKTETTISHKMNRLIDELQKWENDV
jgi:hypothetical protein